MNDSKDSEENRAGHSNVTSENSGSIKSKKCGAQRIIFKPLPLNGSNLLNSDELQCIKIRDTEDEEEETTGSEDGKSRRNGTKIKQIYIPKNIKDPDQISRILNAVTSINKLGVNNIKKEMPGSGEDVRTNEVRNTESESNQAKGDSISGLSNNKKKVNQKIINSTTPPKKPFTLMTMEERIERLNSTIMEDQIPLPSINIFRLKELEVNEIVKNAQLRHDIVFDPDLQFRPNLDGNIGIKKREVSQLYWNDVENEIFIYQRNNMLFNSKKSRLIPLFDNIRKITMTIVTPTDHQTVRDVLNAEMIIQNLINNSLDMPKLSEWIYSILKKYCAPMRDKSVETLKTMFDNAIETKSLHAFVNSISFLLQILETMRLDIANHQIRLLRPALIANSAEFERQFNQNILSKPNNAFVNSFTWFKKSYDIEVSKGTLIIGQTTPKQIYRLVIKNILNLTSCTNMTDEIPKILSTDKSRLSFLRSEIRQITCLMICKLLFDQLVAQNEMVQNDKQLLSCIKNHYSAKQMIDEIISIVKDDSGNYKWTKSTLEVSLHLCHKIEKMVEEYRDENNKTNDKDSDKTSKIPTFASLDDKKVEFAKNWLSKQTQPNSPVYGLLEKRIFKAIENIIFSISDCTSGGDINQNYIKVFSSNKQKTTLKTLISSTRENQLNSSKQEDTETNHERKTLFLLSEDQTLLPISLGNFENIILLAFTLTNFHWSVVGNHYIQFLGNNIATH